MRPDKARYAPATLAAVMDARRPQQRPDKHRDEQARHERLIDVDERRAQRRRLAESIEGR